MRCAFYLILAAFLLGLTPVARAEKPAPANAPPKQVEVTADQTLEWYQDQQIYVARGNAKAVRGDMVVDADVLTAHERDKPPKGSAPVDKTKTKGNDNGTGDIDTMTADGHVRITNPRQRVTGDHAVYDLDKHVAVVTGNNLKYETEKDVVTARDSLEYWEDKKIAVARGNAVGVRGDRRVEGDVLTAEFRDDPNGTSELWKMTAEGHVTVITKGDISRGDNAVYDVNRDIAILRGNVRITRADGTQLSGDVGEVDFATNQSRLMNDGTRRVRALLVSKTSNKTADPKNGKRIYRYGNGTTMTAISKGKVIPFSDDENKSSNTDAVLGKGLVAEHLGKQYNKRPVVHDVSLSLQRGEVVGLLGPNGAGKTTCFYLVTGLVKPDFGNIRMDGVDVTSFPMYRRARLGLGYLPQEASIFRGLSVEDNIRAVLEVIEPDYDAREAMLQELLAEFGITHLRRAPSIALSGGERRRLEIARALASQPHFVLLDEPFAGIDPIALGDIRDLVVHLRERGIGVLITDHNVRATLAIVDRAYIIHDGRVLMKDYPGNC